MLKEDADYALFVEENDIDAVLSLLKEHDIACVVEYLVPSS